MLHLLLGILVSVGAVLVYLGCNKDSKIVQYIVRHEWYLPVHVALCVYCVLLGDFGRTLKAKSFGTLMVCLGNIMKKDLERHKGKLFKTLKDVKGSGQHGPRILEIGAGFGSNFGYYPETCEVLIEEPDPEYREHTELKIKERPGATLVGYYEVGAEDLSPIEDRSVDAVVGTFVLCTVTDVQKVLQEVRRVLKPGGQFYSFEHVLDTGNTPKRLIQSVLNLTRFYPYCADGCHFRNSLKALENSGFDTSTMWTALPENLDSFMVYCCSPYCYGVVTV